MPDKNTNHHRTTSLVNPATIGLAAVVLVAAGGLAASLLLPGRVPSTVAASTGSAVVDVTSQVYDGSHQVSVTPQLSPAQVLRSPAGGIVTRTDCTAGGTVSSGASPLSVNGEPILALATSVPLWRDLTVGARGAEVMGADVSAVQAELARLGYSAPDTGVYDAGTRAAMSALWATIGVTNPGDLPFAWVMWLPSAEVTIATCAHRSGDPISAGEQVAQIAGALQSLTLSNPPGEGWVAQYGDVTAPVEANGQVADPAFLAAVEAGPELSFFISSGGSGSLSLKVALATPRDVVVVPPSAVIASGQGKGCVVTDGKPVAVDIVSSSLGQTMVAVTGSSVPKHVEASPDPTVRCS